MEKKSANSIHCRNPIYIAATILQLRFTMDPAAKDNSITNAATARSNLDAAIYNAICRRSYSCKTQ